jgi:hypothetical protein
MMYVVAISAVLGMIAASAGFGLLGLALSGADRFLRSAMERAMIGLVLGIGVMGWLLIFPGVLGLFTPFAFWGVLAAGVGAFLFRIRSLKGTDVRPPVNHLDILLYFVLAFAAGFDLLEAIAPPADADTLAYHFALPRDFLAEGQISFVARAVSGAIPLLLHMTYAAAMTTGGELALTLWSAVTGWVPGLLLYAFVRRELDRTWSLALLALFTTTPMVLYGGGSGQIEIRCAAFALASVTLLLIAERETSLRLLALSGICAGFFVAAKYYGLIFAGAAGLMVIFHRDGFRRGLVFGIAVVVAGFQWYLWNHFHTGDPVFPMLTNMLQFPDSPFWTREFGTYFQDTLARGELPLERTFINWALYPVYSVFNLVERLEGGRTGMGILCVLILPAFVAAIMSSTDRRRETFVPLAVTAVFFTVWFFSGTTQRTRHLLPIYPLFLLVAFPAAIAWIKRTGLTFPMAAGLSITLAIQLAGHGLFTVNAGKYTFSAESRESFLRRNVPGANAALWINANLTEKAKIGFMNRQLAYLISKPAFMIHPHIQTVIDARPGTRDANRFVAGIKRQGLTHLLVSGDWSDPKAAKARAVPFFDMIGGLIERGCLGKVKKLDTVQIPSRTLAGFGGTVHKSQDWILEIHYGRCQADQ